MEMTEMGRRIALLRREKGLTQKQLADLVHVTDKAVSKWEQGKNFPNLSILEPLAMALGCSAAALLGLDENAAGEAISLSVAIYEEEKTLWLRELRKRAWAALVFQLLIFVGLVLISRYLDKKLLYGYPMSLLGIMTGLCGTLIGSSIWTIRTGGRLLGRTAERQSTRQVK